MKFFKSILALFFSFTCAPAPGFTEAERSVPEVPGPNYVIERAQQRYFDYWYNPRTLSLSQASVVHDTGTAAVTGNPAGLGLASAPGLEITYDYNQIGAKDRVSEYQHIGSASIALPLRWGTTKSGIGLAWNGLQGGPNDVPLNSENRTHALVLAAGFQWSDALTLGYSFGWMRNEIYSNVYDFEMDSGFKHTLGAQYTFGDARIGLMTSLGHGRYGLHINDAFTGASNPRQLSATLGAAYNFSPFDFFASLDYRDYRAESDAQVSDPIITVGGDESGHSFSPAFGVETSPLDWLRVRAGARRTYRRHFFARNELSTYRDEASYSAWSVGAGVVIPGIEQVRIDFGFEERRLGRGNREFSLGVTLPLSKASGV